jgi:small subunit ribosomal protein S4
LAVNRDPVLKKCKALGISPAVLGIRRESKRAVRSGRRKLSEYGVQLREKQKAKFIYGVLERQFRRYFGIASKARGATGLRLLQLLETRLDNVIFRLGLSSTRREARQFVTHGHFLVNGKRIDIPSYPVKLGDVISIREQSRSAGKIKKNLEEMGTVSVPKWLLWDSERLCGSVAAMPAAEDIDVPIEVHFIVELYSK